MDVDHIFTHDGSLAACFPGFEEREGQRAMAAAVGSALIENRAEDEAGCCRIVVVEAETGIGKTLAYLVPAALSGKRVVIATATLNLQDQIIEKDLPLVERIIDQPVAAVCVKGRENYLCLYRWYQYRSNPQLSLLDDKTATKIDGWLKKTATGDRAELNWLGEHSSLWSKISARSSQCLGGECPEGAECFVTRLRKKAGSAQLLIVNHHLFFSDLALKKGGYGEILPRYESVIFDEAHHIENVASTFFGRSFSQFQLLDLLGDIEQQAKLDLPAGSLDELLSVVGGMRRRIDSFTDIFPGPPGRYHLQTLVEDISKEVWLEHVELLIAGISRLGDRLGTYSSLSESWNVFIRRAGELEQTLEHIALGDDTDSMENIRWYEKRERSVVLSTTPIEIAPSLCENLYSSVETCVLTSATLSIGGSFSYLQQRLGLDDRAEFLRYSSPFDYENRSLLYVPEAPFPQPAMEEFTRMSALRIVEILRATRGRGLVLCTSLKNMEDIAETLREQLEYPVFVQGSQSRSSLLIRFREETHSVLVAVASFWEGIDVAGDSLSCVIIDKLPFEVPTDPVLQARIDKIQRDGRNPFFTFQVPRAVLTLRQGVGRLMRSASDRGVVAIMDVRLYNKGYGKTFLKSLPPSPVSRDLDDIGRFFLQQDTP